MIVDVHRGVDVKIQFIKIDGFSSNKIRRL
jgi:hypothetical protein